MSWLHDDLTRPLDAPVKSTLATRSAWLLIAVIWQFCVERAERFRKRDIDHDGRDDTFCNFFMKAVADAMGVTLPQLRANALAEWLSSPMGKAAGWEEVTEHVAQRMADEGQLACAVWSNPTGGSGHVAPLVPSLGQPGTWTAQAGWSNFSRGQLASGFGDKLPTFFAHP